MSDPSLTSKIPHASSLTEARLRKIEELEDLGIPPFTTGFVPDVNAAVFKQRFGDVDDLELLGDPLHMAGRIMALRILGKASFLRLSDESGDFQAYLARDTLGVENYKLVKKLDVGDIIGVRGRPFRTRTGELSILVDYIQILTKSLRPLPEKWHGLSDVETRYRQRYLDLIVSPSAKDLVRTRSKYYSLSQKLPDDTELPGSRNTDDADHSGRGHCQTF